MNLRHQAVGMILGGKSSREVAKALEVNQSSVVRWFQKHNSGEDLSDRKRSGRPTVMSKISKMVVSKSLTKKRQSTRKLAERLTRHGHAMSHTTVHNYLTQKLGVRSFKRCKIPKLTEEAAQILQGVAQLDSRRLEEDNMERREPIPTVPRWKLKK